jgi:hypothetical protein
MMVDGGEREKEKKRDRRILAKTTTEVPWESRRDGFRLLAR